MPTRTDTELLAQLRELLAGGHVRLDLDAVRLDKPDSPVSVQAESTRWLYALTLGAGAAAWWLGVAAGIAASAAAVGLWYGVARPDVARRIRRRVETVALHDAGLWRRVWRHGGLALGAAGAPPCRAPDGNWMEFVRVRCPPRRSEDGR
jgi:hypothetical protein